MTTSEDILQWDGFVRAAALGDTGNRERQDLSSAGRSYDWPRVVSILERDGDLVNTTRPDGASRYTPLHQAAHGGAPVELVQRLIDLGAWRTLQNARGERPLDVAARQGHGHLLSLLEPNLKRHVPHGILARVQAHFHDVIRGRAAALVDEAGLRLPELEPLLEYEGVRMWIGIPGMAGGFLYELIADGVEARLSTSSWSRMADGSGQRHEITSAGSKLVEEGFV